MTKSTEHVLVGAAVVVAAFWLYSRLKAPATATGGAGSTAAAPQTWSQKVASDLKSVENSGLCLLNPATCLTTPGFIVGTAKKIKSWAGSAYCDTLGHLFGGCSSSSGPNPSDPTPASVDSNGNVLNAAGYVVGATGEAAAFDTFAAQQYDTAIAAATSEVTRARQQLAAAEASGNTAAEANWSAYLNCQTLKAAGGGGTSLCIAPDATLTAADGTTFTTADIAISPIKTVARL